MTLFEDNTIVKVEPLYKIAKMGSTVVFHCPTTSKVNWVFRKFEGSLTGLPSNVNTGVPGQNRSMIEIVNVHLANAGYYFCYGYIPGTGYFVHRGLLIVGKFLDMKF